MEAVMIYKASDGTRFDSAEQCVEYEKTAARVAVAVASLGARRDIAAEKYIQHTREAVVDARRGLVGVAKAVYGSSRFPVLDNDPDTIHPHSILGRIIDDAGPHCLRNAWGRIMCINFDNFREYQQPYFALNPNEATIAQP